MTQTKPQVLPREAHPAPRRRFRYTVARYHEAIAAGVLTENDKVELISGELIEKISIGKRRGDCVDRLNIYFVTRFGATHRCRVQNPITIPDISEPEPDYVIVDEASYRTREGNPEPPDVLLLVEVADSSLDFDRTDKAELYARAGIREYWIVNLVDDCVELHTEPDSAGGVYNVILRIGRGRAVASPFCGEVAVDDLLPAPESAETPAAQPPLASDESSAAG